MIRSRFSKYVKAKVRMGIKYYVILRCSVSKPRPFIGLGILIRLQSELVPWVQFFRFHVSHYRNAFQLTVRVCHVINLFFFVSSKPKGTFNFHSYSLTQYPCFSSYFAEHETGCIFFTATGAGCKLFAKSVFYYFVIRLVSYGFYHWNTSFFYCFSFGFRIPSQLKRVQLHL